MRTWQSCVAQHSAVSSPRSYGRLREFRVSIFLFVFFTEKRKQNNVAPWLNGRSCGFFFSTGLIFLSLPISTCPIPCPLLHLFVVLLVEMFSFSIPPPPPQPVSRPLRPAPNILGQGPMNRDAVQIERREGMK